MPIEQKLVTIPYRRDGEGHVVYGAAHEALVNAEIAALNAEGWRVVQVTAHRVGAPGTCLLVERAA
jgi:hypothetical protein